MPEPRRIRAGLLHPLCGSDPTTLLTALLRNGRISANRLPQIAIALTAMLARWPFSAAERAWVAKRLRLQPSMPAPLFIVGHLRSGTTHLQNTLSRAPGFGRISPVALGLPWDMLGLGAVLRPVLKRALPTDRFVDRVRVALDSPQEDEIALASMQLLSYYHAVYFPRRFDEHFCRSLLLENCPEKEVRLWRRRHRYFLKKVSLEQGGRRLVVKNPVYTTRIRLLREIWPDAQFIHVHRDPRRVFVSTVHYFRALLARLALQPYAHIDVERVILDSYPRVMNALIEQSAELQASSYVEVAFERFEREPLAEIERIYARLGLPGLQQARPRFETYLKSVRGYQKNSYNPAPEIMRQVEQAWAPFVERWGNPAFDAAGQA